MSNNERFFGLHFDFHADNKTVLGSRLNEADIEKYILDAKPDFIQCDSKGHPGICSYPSKFGTSANDMKQDCLRIWSSVAKKHGLPLYVHYSGVWDGAYCKAHTNESMQNEDGTRTETVSLFDNGYLDNVMIPQLKEMIAEYGVKGVWVDGDCWAVTRDFSALAKPYLAEQITKEEHNGVMRNAFLRFVKKYVDAIHAFSPDVKITSNWAYTSYMPEDIKVDIDFLSGDYYCQNSAHEARYEGRCMALRGKPWDLMAWSFENMYHTDKPAVQMMQEASMVLSLGGGFQMYITQNRDGSARRYQSDYLQKIGAYVHARRMLFGKVPFAQVGVLYSGDSYYKKSNIYNASGATSALIGALNAVLDAQYTANIIYEYQLDKASEYEILLVPEWEDMSEQTKERLLGFAKRGGNLIVLGAETTRQFALLLGAETGAVEEFDCLYVQHADGRFAGLCEQGMKAVRLQHGEDSLYTNADVRDSFIPAYAKEKVGQGQIIYVPFGFGSTYFNARSYILSDFMKNIFSCVSLSWVKVNYKNVDITLQHDGDSIILNVINMNQSRHSLGYLVYDEIPSLHNVEVCLCKKYAHVMLPLGEEFEVETSDNKTLVRLKRLDIHTVIMLKE